jgi:hypothetical protein
MPTEASAPEFRNPLKVNHIAVSAVREPRQAQTGGNSSNGRLEAEKRSWEMGAAHQFRGRLRAPAPLRCRVVVECLLVFVQYWISGPPLTVAGDIPDDDNDPSPRPNVALNLSNLIRPSGVLRDRRPGSMLPTRTTLQVALLGLAVRRGALELSGRGPSRRAVQPTECSRTSVDSCHSGDSLGPAGTR